jgi:GT2 family glycosyltransferase
MENKGFAAACNQGAKGSKADYLLFLNPDTRLLKDSLVKPVAFMEHPNNHHIGIIGIQLIDDYGEVSCSCARFPTMSRYLAKTFGLDRLFYSMGLGCFMFEWDHCNNREVDQIMGAFFMVRNYLFKTLRGFDERFFVYCEEVDFSLRAQQSGWKSFYMAESQAYHRGGGTTNQVKAKRLFYVLQSQILYIYKHFKITTAIFCIIGILVLEPITRIVFAMINKSLPQIKETLVGYAMFWLNLPELLSKMSSGRVGIKSGV